MHELTIRPGIPVVAELVREASGDRETVGVLVHGARAGGLAQPGPDYDVIRIVTDGEYERRRRSGTIRGRLPVAADRSVDVLHRTLSSIERHVVEPGRSTASYLYGRLVHDPTGEVARLLERLAAAAGERARSSVPAACDEYVDAFIRSVRAERRHDELGQRLQAAESARALLRVLFGLEGRWPPHLDQLGDELGPVEQAQGWPAGYLRFALLQLFRDPAPLRQQELVRRVDRLLETLEVPHEWEERLAAVLIRPRAVVGTRSATNRRMSDARQSPIPQDRVNENVDQGQRARESKHEQRQRERYLEDQGVDERPGTNPKEQPGQADEPPGPAEGGD
jgi:hypothetical protein